MRTAVLSIASVAVASATFLVLWPVRGLPRERPSVLMYSVSGDMSHNPLYVVQAAIWPDGTLYWCSNSASASKENRPRYLIGNVGRTQAERCLKQLERTIGREVPIPSYRSQSHSNFCSTTYRDGILIKDFYGMRTVVSDHKFRGLKGSAGWLEVVSDLDRIRVPWGRRAPAPSLDQIETWEAIGETHCEGDWE